ncbi:Protein bfr2 [Exophiala dermatitidis]
MKNVRQRVRDLELKRAKDFDPEDDAVPSASDAESENDQDLKENAGREHYEAVGKSKLRKPEQPALGAKYGGVAVSRDALNGQDEEDEDPFAHVEESDDDDPFAARNGVASSESEAENGLPASQDGDESEEIDSDEALGESDVEKFKNFKFRGSKKNRIEDDVSDALSDEDEDENEDSEGTDGSDVDMEDDDSDITDDDEDADSSASSATSKSSAHLKAGKSKSASHNPDREELKRLAFSTTSTAGLASALSAGAKADIQKGRAVKQQRQTFDRLLDARIKLQKGISAANDLASSLTDEQVQQAARQAEDAALALWLTIDSIRCTVLSHSSDTNTSTKDSSSSSLKRKRPLQATRSTSLADMWQHTTDLEDTARSIRRQILDRWHAKTQPVLDTAPRSKLLQPQSSAGGRSRLTDVLDTYLATESGKLITQSWTTNNVDTAANGTGTATSATAAGTGGSGRGIGIYDDSIFYQSLLRDLIASRTAAASTAAAGVAADGTTIPLLPPKLHPSGSRHKKVDTKASKGRKVRYTVHEKLENFMAPEDRNTWEDAARTEFFASLLGNAAGKVLNEPEEDEDGEEQEDVDGDGAVDGTTNGEAAALRLFRN